MINTTRIIKTLFIGGSLIAIVGCQPKITEPEKLHKAVQEFNNQNKGINKLIQVEGNGYEDSQGRVRIEFEKGNTLIGMIINGELYYIGEPEVEGNLINRVYELRDEENIRINKLELEKGDETGEYVYRVPMSGTRSLRMTDDKGQLLETGVDVDEESGVEDYIFKIPNPVYVNSDHFILSITKEVDLPKFK